MYHLPFEVSRGERLNVLGLPLGPVKDKRLREDLGKVGVAKLQERLRWRGEDAARDILDRPQVIVGIRIENVLNTVPEDAGTLAEVCGSKGGLDDQHQPVDGAQDVGAHRHDVP